MRDPNPPAVKRRAPRAVLVAGAVLLLLAACGQVVQTPPSGPAPVPFFSPQPTPTQTYSTPTYSVPFRTLALSGLADPLPPGTPADAVRPPFLPDAPAEAWAAFGFGPRALAIDSAAALAPLDLRFLPEEVFDTLLRLDYTQSVAFVYFAGLGSAANDSYIEDVSRPPEGTGGGDGQTMVVHVRARLREPGPATLTYGYHVVEVARTHTPWTRPMMALTRLSIIYEQAPAPAE